MHYAQRHAAGEYLSSLLHKRKTPGLQYLFVDRDEVLFRFNGGYADIELKVPVRDATTFNGYSVTKTFTAAAVAKLAIEGEVDLDAPISRYVDDFPYQAAPTVRQTLQHTGGFPNPNPIAWIHRAEEHETFDYGAFVHAVTHEHAELRSKPGESYSYSNVGYLLLGELVAETSGRPYDQYILAEIVDPLSLVEEQRISFLIDPSGSHAHGYIRKWNWLNLILGWFIDREAFLDGSVGGWVQFQNILVNGAAYGGIIASASGLARYLQAALRVEKPFTREMLDLLWGTETMSSGVKGRTSLGWAHGSLGGHRYFAHSGGGGGYYCEIRVYPGLKLASVIMTNNTGISNQNYLDGIDRFLLPNRDRS